MKGLLQNLINIGVKQSYQPWEMNLTRRLNAITLIAFGNILTALFFLFYFENTQFNPELIFALIVLPFVFFINWKKNYTWSIYWYFITDFIFFVPVTLKMGINSYVILYYFPMIVGLTILLGRKETMNQLFILSGLCILSIITVILGYKFKFYPLFIDLHTFQELTFFNILLSFISTIVVTLFLVYDFIQQENTLKKVLHEKEILLAEVFHRVKNNLNVITSLLNLKKNTVESPEAKLAIEECKNRVYSMALVHQNIFRGTEIVGLNFKEYIETIVTEIAKSFGEKDNVQLIFDTEELTLDLNKAVSCGLILNELITNSFKYAQTKEDNLQITVKFKRIGGNIELEVKDNGPGITNEQLNSTNTLGIELIKTLAEQINATYIFENNNGSIFRLIFKQDV